jgi:predicted GH43/DUF377 family glycosyl hydrolase
MLFCDKSGCREEFAKDPCVIKFNERYYLYYSIWFMDNDMTKLGIGIATSTNLEDWEVLGRVPLTQDCEMRGIGAPGAIVLNNTIHLFYQTYENGVKDAICHAMSVDGIHFIKDATNPIFSPTTDWCCGRAIDADVVCYKNKLFLYFATRDHSVKIQKIGVASAEIGSDFSRNCWKQEVPQAILSPEFKWEGECIEAPATFTWNDKVYMFYGGDYNCSPQQIGIAVSKDGIHFDKVYNQPILHCGNKGDWNESESGHPYVFIDDTKMYLFYQGSPDGGERWYLSKCEFEMVNDLPKIIQ